MSKHNFIDKIDQILLAIIAFFGGVLGTLISSWISAFNTYKKENKLSGFSVLIKTYPAGTLLFFCIIVIAVIAWLCINHYRSYREISVTPINNVSSRVLHKLFKKLNKMFNKLIRCYNKTDFQIKVPYYDEKNGKVLCKSQTIQNYKDPFLDKIADECLCLKRILLELGQEKLRIKIGLFLQKYKKFNYEGDAEIDYIGWTKLLNDNSSGVVAIKETIEKLRSEYVAAISAQEYSDANKLALKISRAYRHLGTTYYTYHFLKKYNLQLDECIKKGMNWLNVSRYVTDEEIEAKKKDVLGLVFVGKNGDLDEELQKQYTRLAVGIKYNECLMYYYISSDKRENNHYRLDCLKTAQNMIDKLFNAIYEYDLYLDEILVRKDKHKNDKNLKDFDKKLYKLLNEPHIEESYLQIDYIENHRKVKIYSLFIEIFINDKSKKDKVEYARNKIKKILDDNIYIDEAMEMFVFNEINKLKK